MCLPASDRSMNDSNLNALTSCIGASMCFKCTTLNVGEIVRRSRFLIRHGRSTPTPATAHGLAQGQQRGGAGYHLSSRACSSPRELRTRPLCCHQHTRGAAKHCGKTLSNANKKRDTMVLGACVHGHGSVTELLRRRHGHLVDHVGIAHQHDGSSSHEEPYDYGDDGRCMCVRASYNDR
jgi:hypothetical protein